jgi:hypothetical protein
VKEGFAWAEAEGAEAEGAEAEGAEAEAEAEAELDFGDELDNINSFYLLEIIHMNSELPTQLLTFYDNRARKPEQYFINKKGEYVYGDLATNDVEKVLYVPPDYRAPTATEIQEAEDRHRQSLKANQMTVMTNVKKLYEFIQSKNPVTTDELTAYYSEINKLNIKIAKAEEALFNKQNVLRDIIHYKSIPKNQVLFEVFC